MPSTLSGNIVAMQVASNGGSGDSGGSDISRTANLDVLGTKKMNNK